MEIHIDGVLCTGVADFAEKNGHGAATVAGWLDKAKESEEQVLKDIKPLGRIGNSNLYAETDLLFVKARFGRAAKPKPISLGQYEQVMEHRDRLVLENAELRSQLIEADAWLEYGKEQCAELSRRYKNLRRQCEDYKRQLEQFIILD